MSRATTPGPTRGRRLGRIGVGVGLLSGLTLGACAVGGTFFYQDLVVNHPGEHLKRANVMSVIVQESPVYYRDGQTRLGVFFEDEHREFVSWERLPQGYVMAIVAAEDGDFWTHFGFSPLHIGYAMYRNMRAGRVVAGGSTLTQQTAKNLFYRPDRSLKSKLTELLNALRLEAHYDKSEILTFYANQFHVSGNGRGIGIAARYFFDKDVSQLSLLEQAFLAGLVKAPSYYDPFIGDAERQTRSIQRATDRTRYVLKRLVKERATTLVGLKPIAGDPASRIAYEERLQAAILIKSEAEALLKGEFVLDFKRGTFRFDSSAVLDEVARRLQEPPFADVLAKAGISDPAKSGLQVITSLDVDVQRESIYGLWHHLSEVGTWVEGLSAKDYVLSPRSLRHDPQRVWIEHEFSTAKVVSRTVNKGKTSLNVDLGGQLCVVDRAAMIRVARAIWRGAKRNRSVKVPTVQVNATTALIVDGDFVWTSIRERAADGGLHCDLEVRPELQGASLVAEDGQIRAMVGGNDNRNFNRATALRQMGSTWKPLIYHAALKLGWAPTDMLQNARSVFPYSGTFYYPRPDHAPRDVVSMAWAGVRSENIASVWLLYHLLDRLDGEQVRSLAETLGFSQADDEPIEAYRTRIQKLGVLPTRARVNEGFFLQARHEVMRSLLRDSDEAEALAVQGLLYGWGFSGERSRVNRGSARKRAEKGAALDNSWRVMSRRIRPCERAHQALKAALEVKTLPNGTEVSNLSVFVEGDIVKVACGTVPDGYTSVYDGLSEWVDRTNQIVQVPNRVPLFRFPKIFREEKVTGPGLEPLESMRVDGRLRWGSLDRILSGMKRRELARSLAGAEAPDLYDPEVLYWHQDFRVLLSMRYVQALARRYGVQTPIQPVLSMPLGSSEITLEESVSLYEGLSTGLAWRFPGESASGATFESPPAPLLLIQEIRDVDGRVLYRVNPTAEAIAPPEVGQMTADILRNVVRWGTGQRASRAVVEGHWPIPLTGKTGTTNGFRNAVFMGVAPRAEGAHFSIESGFTVGSYVGYDDNRPMSSGRIHLSGSSGALPAWLGAVRGLHHAGLLGIPVATSGQESWDILAASVNLERLLVDRAQGGLPVEEQPIEGIKPDQPSVLTRPKAAPPGLRMNEVMGPRVLRIAPRTTEIIRLLQQRLREHEAAQSVWGTPSK